MTVTKPMRSTSSITHELDMTALRPVVLLLVVLVLGGCSGPKPVLYPNTHLTSVGKETADNDIQDCQEMADEAGADKASGEVGTVARGTAVGAGVGAASGAVGGAISGGVGIGSAIGAASGAVWGLLMGLWKVAVAPPRSNHAYTNFMDVCLQNKGYEVSGWQ